MNDYVIWILLTSFWCWGFHNAFEDGQILYKVHVWLSHWVPYNLLKPLISCPICMTSVHGTFWYWYSQDNYSFLTWIMFIVASSGLNYVIYNLFPHSEINVKNHF